MTASDRQSRNVRRYLCNAVVVASLIAPLTVVAQEQPLPPAPANTETATHSDAPSTPSPDTKSSSATPSDHRNSEGCGEQNGPNTWLDRLHSNLYRLTCSTASWFDGLFGDRRADQDYHASTGILTTGGLWSQRDNLQKILRFHAHLFLPQLSDRFHAFVGRVDSNEFVSESKTDIYGLPSAFNHNLDDSTLLGLGYSEPLKKRGSFDVDTGVHLQFPLDPYVKGSYRFARPIGDNDLIRLRETIFWENIEGFGVTTRLDWDHVITEHHLLRWTNSATYSQAFDSRIWNSALSLYQVISTAKKSAFEYQIAASGGIDSPVVTRDTGFAVIYRQSVFRPWLILELRTGMDWPRDLLDDHHHSNFNAGLAFEMRYGDK